MDKLLKLYSSLLNIYTEQVNKLENEKRELERKYNIQWIPYSVLNNRFFILDELLGNPYHGGHCLEEKNLIMPHYMSFIAAYENSTDEEKNMFEKAKPTSQYQEYLDQIYLNRGSFMDFLQSQLREADRKDALLREPSRPQRSNATRQLSKYKDDKREYDERMESNERCRLEIKDRIEVFKALKDSQ